jgi:hypothetical protein
MTAPRRNDRLPYDDMQQAREIAARCWCDPRTSRFVMQAELAEVFAETLVPLLAAAEMLWVVIANVNGGDWEKQSQEWQDAAAEWRDNYFHIYFHIMQGMHQQPRAADDSSGQPTKT